MLTLLITFLVFSASALVLALVQRLRRAPLPVGCTPVNGECCLARDAGASCPDRAGIGSVREDSGKAC